MCTLSYMICWPKDIFLVDLDLALIEELQKLGSFWIILKKSFWGIPIWIGLIFLSGFLLSFFISNLNFATLKRTMQKIYLRLSQQNKPVRIKSFLCRAFLFAFYYDVRAISLGLRSWVSCRSSLGRQGCHKSAPGESWSVIEMPKFSL